MRTQSPNDRADASVSTLNDDNRLISKAELERIIKRVIEIDPEAASETRITVQAWWQGELRWARNKTNLAGDRRDIRVLLERRAGLANEANSPTAKGNTNQIDDDSLKGLVQAVGRSIELQVGRRRNVFGARPPLLPSPTPQIWSNATYDASLDKRESVVRTLVKTSAEYNFLSAGYLEMRGVAEADLDPRSAKPNEIQHQTLTQAQCSMTVRHPKGVGSGWAGRSSFDWSTVDATALANIALEKCKASLNPVAIEPGRYTVVLEPQAVCDFVSPVVDMLNEREVAENGVGPFALDYDIGLKLYRTKLGLQVIDERLTISHNPLDPQLGVVAQPGMGSINWIDRGVLTTLGYNRGEYSLEKLNANLPQSKRAGFQISGGSASLEQLIQGTKRGLLVTRFSGIQVVDYGSLLSIGFTRDGLWLIENGKISKTVKNFRFTESPMFMLNQIEELGVPQPVFKPVRSPYGLKLSPVLVPAIRAKDFSFTSMIDAV